MTPTEISEHAKAARLWFNESAYKILFDESLVAIQHGINLAAESKDKRIAELEAACLRNAKRDGSWIDECGSCRVCGGEIPHGHSDDCDYYKQEQQLQSKDQEIGRLKTERDMWKATANTSAAHKSEQLTEANAKLAEVMQHYDKVFAIAESQTDKLSSAQAEIKRLNEIPRCSGNFACGGICPPTNSESGARIKRLTPRR